MENASRALLMAAGVLMGILLLSVMVYVFSQGGRVNQTYDQKQITNQLELYNSKFEKYDKDNNNIIDVISLANLAFDVNEETEYDSSNAVKIEIVIGDKTYTLPNENHGLERNLILDNSNNPISIYNLVELPMVTNITGKESLGIGRYSISGGTVEYEDCLTTSKLIDGKTIYKYLFKVADSGDFEYHKGNLKVSKVKLTAYYNSEW